MVGCQHDDQLWRSGRGAIAGCQWHPTQQCHPEKTSRKAALSFLADVTLFCNTKLLFLLSGVYNFLGNVDHALREILRNFFFRTFSSFFWSDPGFFLFLSGAFCFFVGLWLFLIPDLSTWIPSKCTARRASRKKALRHPGSSFILSSLALAFKLLWTEFADVFL